MVNPVANSAVNPAINPIANPIANSVNPPLRILWVGDAGVASGFARCTHAVCDYLHLIGHQVAVLGINYWGDPNPFPYPIYPCISPFGGGDDNFGTRRLPALAAELKPDVIVILNDCWNIPGYLSEMKEAVRVGRAPESILSIPVIGWIAVDSENQRGDFLNPLARVAVWTTFAADQLVKGGYRPDNAPPEESENPISTIDVIPLAVNSRIFTTVTAETKALFRASVAPGIPSDSFIVGVVGRNQDRKRLDLSIRYFAHWVKSHSIHDAYLYLYVAPTGDRRCDYVNLSRYYDIPGRIIYINPHIGIGNSEHVLAMFYQSFDVYLSTSQGEGWGLPALEAMACGIPTVLPDFAAFSTSGGWVGNAPLLVPCPTPSLNAPGFAYTIGAIPDERRTIHALNAYYHDPELRALHSQRGLTVASHLSWLQTAEMMTETILRGVEDHRASLEAIGGAIDNG